MIDEPVKPVLGAWLAAEIGVLLVLFVGLSASLLGVTDAGSSYSRPLRIAALAFVTAEMLIPTWIYYDVWRRPGETSTVWVHAAAIPVINFFGLVGYLDERRRSRDR